MGKLKLILLLLPTVVFSQTSDNVTLNVTLNPIQSLIVNPQQKTVDLTYSTKADYLNGVISKQENHLTVFSTGGFEIKVKSNNTP